VERGLNLADILCNNDLNAFVWPTSFQNLKYSVYRIGSFPTLAVICIVININVTMTVCLLTDPSSVYTVTDS
jgi:hypothetical protein